MGRQGREDKEWLCKAKQLRDRQGNESQEEQAGQGKMREGRNGQVKVRGGYKRQYKARCVGKARQSRGWKGMQGQAKFGRNDKAKQ